MNGKLARIFYLIGCLTGQFVLFIKSMRQAGKHFKEFDKFLKEEIKRGKLKTK